MPAYSLLKETSIANIAAENAGSGQAVATIARRAAGVVIAIGQTAGNLEAASLLDLFGIVRDRALKSRTASPFGGAVCVR